MCSIRSKQTPELASGNVGFPLRATNSSRAVASPPIARLPNSALRTNRHFGRELGYVRSGLLSLSSAIATRVRVVVYRPLGQDEGPPNNTEVDHDVPSRRICKLR